MLHNFIRGFHVFSIGLSATTEGDRNGGCWVSRDAIGEQVKASMRLYGLRVFNVFGIKGLMCLVQFLCSPKPWFVGVIVWFNLNPAHCTLFFWNNDITHGQKYVPQQLCRNAFGRCSFGCKSVSRRNKQQGKNRNWWVVAAPFVPWPYHVAHDDLETMCQRQQSQGA